MIRATRSVVGARRAIGVLGVATSAAFAAACAPSQAPRTTDPVEATAAIREAGTKIAALRETQSRTDRLAVTFDGPWLPDALSSRGAVSISSPAEKSLRLLLVGPGGTTAMDLWMRDDRYRLALPALDRVVRGSLHDPLATRRTLPVDFLAWWMLAPFEGRVLWAVREQGGLRVILRRESAYLDVRLLDSGAVSAVRKVWSADALSSEEHITASATRCPYVVDYFHVGTRLRVKVSCESTSAKVNPAAFLPPTERE